MVKVSSKTMVRIADYVEPVKAADMIGCTSGRVYQMLRNAEFRGLLPIGKNRFLIPRKEVERVAKNPAKTGRPRKNLAS